MTIWIIFVAMAAAVMAVLLWPVVRARDSDIAADRNAYDRAIFRDQLAELDRDVANGAIGAREAEAARNEVSRRLIGAVAPAPERRSATSLFLAFVATLVVPAIALSLYVKLGQPHLPDVPLAERMANAEASGDFEALLAKVEKHLADNPRDVKGWQVLAPAYERAKRWTDAANAYGTILELAPPTAETLASYAEMLTFANQGMVTADAHRAALQALAIDPKLPKARFFDALALKQEGKTEEASKAFAAFLAETPADAPWRPMLEAEIKDMRSKPPAPGAEAMAAVEGMSADDQQAMIRNMVEGLDARLRESGDDLEGWLRLIRARTVLKEADKAAAAYQTAKEQFKDNGEALAALDTLAKELNLQ